MLAPQGHTLVARDEILGAALINDFRVPLGRPENSPGLQSWETDRNNLKSRRDG
jgi:hypothetical protein